MISAALNRLCAAVLILLFLVVCEGEQQPRTRIYGAAAAEGLSDGRVIERTPREQDPAAMDEFTAALLEINKKFSGPELPDASVRHHRVISVGADGVLMLEDGSRIVLDGLRCSEYGIRAISKILLEPDSRVVVEPSISEAEPPVPAEVWLVSLSYEKFGLQSPTHSMLADTALLSGWCRPERTKTTRRYERYAALAKFGASRRREL